MDILIFNKTDQNYHFCTEIYKHIFLHTTLSPFLPIIAFTMTTGSISSLYVCMAIKHIIVVFVETPRKFITCSNKFTWCFHKHNYYNRVYIEFFCVWCNVLR